MSADYKTAKFLLKLGKRVPAECFDKPKQAYRLLLELGFIDIDYGYVHKVGIAKDLQVGKTSFAVGDRCTIRGFRDLIGKEITEAKAADA